ncbi:hypothetical protein BWQ93_18645 [Sphingopyxis sp. QXT-31]|uniref:hypothetical protein n=1 Tax=Sphingopyxis sp. QXT-31 TaxID=1357916 RepID=UPI0009791003|nr:hypothetical protein [Sphingopyxis sp. QXT-31]AQA00251.1 hypothetical protein BWQ93_18645 [Sphingopyxis sp. QXT-31]
MKTLNFASSLAVLSVLACTTPSQPATAAAQESGAENGDMRWSVEPDGGKDRAPKLRLSHRRTTSDLSLDADLGVKRPEFGAAQSALGGSGPVRFSVRHESGTLECSGTLAQSYDGEGRCSFTPDAAFERALASRGLAPDKRGDLFAMLIVDATIELADGLTAEGVKPGDWDDLVAAAALEVTPAFVRGFKGTSLQLSDVRDLNAAGFAKLGIDDVTGMKALGVTGDYVRELRTAGYDKLSAEDVIGMKAMGVTGDYARRMNGAAGGTR